LILSVSPFISLSTASTTFLHHAAFTSSIGLNGAIVFPVGVDFVFIFNGVVGDACAVVKA
jgi:hypothetical protein